MEDASGSAILERIKQAAGGVSDPELAKLLKLSRQSITKAKATKSVPHSWVPKAALLFNVTTDWLFFGREPMRAGDTQSAPEITPQATCAHCAELEDELKTERAERRELAAENRKLWRENGELRERVARLEAGMDRRTEPPAEASLFDERPLIPSSSQATPPTDKPI